MYTKKLGGGYPFFFTTKKNVVTNNTKLFNIKLTKSKLKLKSK